MPTPTTLNGFWSEEVARQQASLAAARLQQIQTQTEEQAALAAYAASASALQAAKDKVEACRKQLAAIALPADSAPVLAQMRAALIAVRQAAASHVRNAAAQRRLAEQRQAQAIGVTAAEQALAAAQQEKQAAEAASAVRQPWLAGALGGLKTNAQAALTDLEAAARAKVEADLPSHANDARSLLKQARLRAALAAAAQTGQAELAAGVQDASADWQEASSRKADKLARLAAGFALAVAALGRFAQSQPSIDQARASLQALASLAGSALSAAQQAELFDPAQLASREAALEKLAACDDKRRLRDAAENAYQAGLFSARFAAPDSSEADLQAVPPLKPLFDARNTAQGQLDSAETALAAVAGVLESWFAAVPEPVWERLEQLDAALATLKAIKDSNITDLKAAVSNGEKALAEALDAASLERRQLAVLHDALARREAEARAGMDLLPGRQRAALRFIAPV